ncbi:hypothetical protein RHH80_03030 [Clostridioides difficile]|nr:hypothetical protein [Clostridioides difficile]
MKFNAFQKILILMLTVAMIAGMLLGVLITQAIILALAKIIKVI